MAKSNFIKETILLYSSDCPEYLKKYRGTTALAIFALVFAAGFPFVFHFWIRPLLDSM